MSKIKNNIFKIIYFTTSIIIILALIFYIAISIFKLNNLYENNISENKEMEGYKELSFTQNAFYCKIIKNSYANNYNSPYIPEGFKYLEGTWNSGYVIQDSNKNEYVWVPCTNLEIAGVPKLEKNDYSPDPYVKSNICYDLEYEAFLNSALKYGGFYVSRYEIGKENELPVSKKNALVWNKITPQDSIEIAKTMYSNSKDFKCELINGYAYDTMIAWIYDTVGKDNIKYDYLEIDNSKEASDVNTGRNMYNNIYDIFDDIQEITQEYTDNTPISRGTTKRIDDEEMKQKYETRLYTINNLYWNDLTFRTMLYKEN